jgi:uncharacterized membrane protein YfcA
VTEFLLVVVFAAVAALYASVGHAGASGYLGVLALAGFAAGQARPAALVMNVAVALVASWRFGRVPGLFRWSHFLPFATASIPAAWLGGRLPLEQGAFRVAVGVVLLSAAGRMLWHVPAAEVPIERRPPLGPALALGAVIGLASGWIGVGGGIFLSPLLIALGWASTRQASAIAAPFILVNSLAGLAGLGLSAAAAAGPQLLAWIPAVLAGGWAGASFGSRRGSSRTLRRLLAAVLLLAGGKLLLT